MRIKGILAGCLALLPYTAGAVDLGFFVKAGYGGRAKIEHPTVTRTIYTNDVQITPEYEVVETEVVTTETIDSHGESFLAFTYGLGLVFDQAYSLEFGNVDTIDFWSSDDNYNGLVDFQYLAVNKIVKIFDRAYLLAGVGASRWETQEYVDQKHRYDRNDYKNVTGESPLATVGFDFVLSGNNRRSNNLGLHYYYGYDKDYPHQLWQLEYAFYYW